jgi:ectoine hydrolase
MNSVSLDFSLDEYAQRLVKVRQSMVEQGIDTLLSHDPSNISWLTGYDGWSFYTPQCVIVGLIGEPVWYGRGIDANGARRTVYMDEAQIIGFADHYVMNPPHNAMDYLSATVLPDRGWATGTIGVEMDNYYYSAQAHAALVKGLPQANLVDATGLVNWCRKIKSPQEIEYMRIAGRIVSKMHHTIREKIAVGLPKHLLAAEIYHSGISGVDGLAGDYPAIVPILPSGADASAPHLTWDARPFESGQATFFEIAGCYKRYHCPLSRTIYLGTPDAAYMKAEEAVLEGLENGLAITKPGVRCGDVAAILNQTLSRHGFDRGDARCGYPIGLSYPPDWGERTYSLRPTDDTVLAAGMTFHFMPGLWMDTWGMETTESVLVTANGCEPLANVSRATIIK